MPYPFAHPAAVIPLARPLGRYAVPSALAIGSISPDLWYLVPLVERPESHGIAGLAWFCLPAGLALYLLFHLLLKQPLIALLSPRLGSFTPMGLPRAPLRAVVISLLVGALTHIGWDALAHATEEGWRHNWLQHASTLFGSLFLAAWAWSKLRAAPPAPEMLSPFVRYFTLSLLLGAAAIAAGLPGEPPAADAVELRRFVRSTVFDATLGFGAALLVYCLLFQRKILRRAA
jgi:hypothetical protein